MRRSLQARLGRPQLADGLTIRTFDVGRDEDQWLAVNSKAFSRHPEQGAWTRVDLDQREREPWFDPDGFFLAERGGKIVGFHWTKIHGRAAETPGHPDPGQAAEEAPGHSDPGHAASHSVEQPAARRQDGAAGPGDGTTDHGHEPIGEVYVVGVDPAERGTGLGRALTVIGLRYLRSRGLFQVMLYVDETNIAAIGLYESLGFTHWDTDVMFSTQAASASLSAS
jgi:mycothiol synthase